MFIEGQVAEKLFDDLGFPMDADHSGIIWKLTSNVDHLTRSKVLYHPSVVEKKKD